MPTDATLNDIADLLKQLLAANVVASQVEGLDADGVATLLGIGRSKVYELDGSGMMPAPAEIGVGRCRRWSRGELVAWLRAGSPSRARWQLMRAASMRGVA